MQLQEIRNIAKHYGLKTSNLSKEELIKHIQVAEGNFDCFATATAGYCDQMDCSWRNDCLKLSQKAAH
jgi:hypothetical protein